MGKAQQPENNLSERRMIENEVIFRQVNQEVKEFIKSAKTSDYNALQSFYCECSNPDCLERISLTPNQYEKLHTTNKLFVTISGHQFPEIEKVVSNKGGFQIVEKHDIPPSAEKIDFALKSISSKV